MRPWFETIGVLLLAVLGAMLGRLCSRLKTPYWVLGYALPLLLVGMVVLARRFEALAFISPFSSIVRGRREYVLISFACTMLFTTPLSRLRREREKAMVRIFMSVFVFYFSVLPFLGEALVRGYLSRLETKVNADGVCLQSNSFTCGPAAAVTALRKLDFEAGEGEIAILSHTSPTVGTAPDWLSLALEKRYRSEGLSCDYRHFGAIAELRGAKLTLALIKYALLVDHYVVVLDVTRENVLLADPLVGRITMSHEEFERKWRFSGIVLKRHGNP